MLKVSLLVLILFASVLARAQGGDDDCPVTLGTVGSLKDNNFARNSPWYGDESLAALVPEKGVWRGMGRERNFRDKLWWWSQGYRPGMEKDFRVSGRRLDAESPPPAISRPTNGYNDEIEDPWYAMLVMVEFPDSGCWEITGTYRGETLKIVVEVREWSAEMSGPQLDR